MREVPKVCAEVYNDPAELEEIALKKLKEGHLKDGLKLLLRAAKGYEDFGENERAAKLYMNFGKILLKRTGDLNKSRPSLLKSAYLYLDLIDRLISRVEIDQDVLDEYCLNVLEIFLTLNDEKNLQKYGSQFAALYEDLGETFMGAGDLREAIKAYESAFVYFKLLGDERYKKIAEKLVSIYGERAEEKLTKKDYEGAAEAFERVAVYTRYLFGYDSHYMEMMDTAARNFESASKLAYSEGDLSKTTTLLVRAEYAYLLAGNFKRAKLIGVNTARMLNQVIRTFMGEKDFKKASEKLIELSEALIGIGKIEDFVEPYKKALETFSSIKYRARVRIALLKYLAASEKDEYLLDGMDIAEYYLRRNRDYQALELSESLLEKSQKIDRIRKALHGAEGVY